MFYYFYDSTYIVVLIGAILSMWASFKVQSTYARYSKERSSAGMTGADTAAAILRNNGIYDVSIEHVPGQLTDHYDPKAKVLRLSDAVYNSTSVAAIGVAAHECGHAIQHQENYAPLMFRSALVPAANIGSKAGIPIILLGILLSYNNVLIQIGIWVFSLAVLFQLVTLPVEFNASRRALVMLRTQGILADDELKYTRKVLKSAALTYVASAAAAILQLLRIILITNGRRRDD